MKAIGSKLGIECYKALDDIPDYTPADVYTYCCKHSTGANQFCSYLQVLHTSEGDEIVERVFAFKTKKNDTAINEVIRRTPSTVGGGNDSNKQTHPMIKARNIYYNGYSGYTVVYGSKRSVYYGTVYQVKEWSDEYDMGITTTIINPEVVNKVDAYKYFTFNGPCRHESLINRLRTFRESGKVEVLQKIGADESVTLAKKCEKDKAFEKWLAKNAKESRAHGVIPTVYAYDHKMSIKDADELITRRKIISRDVINRHKYLKDYRDRLVKYIYGNDINVYTYNDYISAAEYVGWEMDHDRVLFPRDFYEMHDKAIEEKTEKKRLEAIKREEDRKKAEAEKKRLEEEFKLHLAEKLLTMQLLAFTSGNMMVVIPRSKADFLYESEHNHNCVGKMDYDKKMFDDKCIIGFMRKTDSPEESFVTVELDGDANTVRQCYADHNSKPTEEAKAFAEEWRKHCKKQLPKMRKMKEVA